ncbi:HDOD domain-containing protein [Chitinimonas sp. BJB300]|uniref:HDOD domain-containing protein n=1 Tax=Chitinimonas sp. BJB300 TaxID=1559339 RepID=UPI0013044D7F|nr:HDOD domain-containing protein [Chitinimonas sp. BJB300]
MTAATPPGSTGRNKTNNEAWLDFWAARPLPILQSTKAALTGYVGKSEAARTDDVVDLVLRDPLLTAHALRHINQRRRSSMTADVVSLENVILLMGLESFVKKFTALPTVESVLLPAHQARYFSLLRHIATARLAAKLAREFGVLRYDARLDEIYVTALLADLPVMLRHIDVGMNEPVPPVELASVMLPLFARWRLPEVFNALLDDTVASNQRSMLHQTALRLAEHLQLGWWQAGIADEVHRAGHALGIEQYTVWEIICRTLLHFARNDWPYPQIFPPARWLPMIAGDWPKPQVKTEKAETKPAEASRPTVQDILRELQHAGQSGASFNQIMGLTIRAHSDGIGLKRIVFGLLLAGQNALKTRYIVGAAENDPLRTFHIDLSAPHIFTKLMLKPQSIWINATNRGQFESLLPRGLRQAIGQGEFLAMSLFVENKPVGIFYADNRGEPVTESQYNAFKQVCLMAGQSLTRQAKRLELGS